MSVKQAIEKLRNGETLNETETGELDGFDADAVLKDLAETTRDRDEARRELQELELRNRVTELAGKSGFTDADYLAYLVKKSRIDVSNATATTEFIATLRKKMPYCFLSALRADRTVAVSAPITANRRAISNDDRIEVITDRLADAIALEN